MNYIKDGSASCLVDNDLALGYDDLSEVFDRFDRACAEDIDPGACCALECDHSLAAAVVLLYLLERRRSFALTPPGVAAPAFCRLRLRPRFNPENRSLDVKLLKNDRFEGSDAPGGEPKLCIPTSGSTGVSKLVVYTHSRLQSNARNCMRRFGLEENDRVALPVPVYHMFGLGAALLPAVAAGASIDIQPGSNVIRFMARERAFRPNVSFLTPAYAAAMTRARRTSRAYRLTVIAGDRLRSEVFEAFEKSFGEVVPLYGTTEMGAIASAAPGMDARIRSETVGRAFPGVSLKLASGDRSELLCSHAHGFEGYVDDRGEVTAADPWFPTGDVATIAEEGLVTIRGRCDRQVNRDGRLVDLDRVEEALRSMDGILDVAVVAARANLRGTGVVAYCKTDPAVTMDPGTVLENCRGLLPPFAVPDRIVVAASLPLLASGKIDRQRMIQEAQAPDPI